MSVSEQRSNGTCASAQRYAQHFVAGVGQAEALLRAHVDAVEVGVVRVVEGVVVVEGGVGGVAVERGVVVVRQLQALEIFYRLTVSAYESRRRGESSPTTSPQVAMGLGACLVLVVVSLEDA